MRKLIHATFTLIALGLFSPAVVRAADITNAEGSVRRLGVGGGVTFKGEVILHYDSRHKFVNPGKEVVGYFPTQAEAEQKVAERVAKIRQRAQITAMARLAGMARRAD